MLMRGREFLLHGKAEQKLEKGEVLTPAEQAIITKFGRTKKRLCGCGCREPLEPRTDGERHSIGGKEVNSDCYFTQMGDEIEKFPIGGHGIRRRG